jgi:hypothetical protein
MKEFERKAKHVTNWTKEIYTVSEEKYDSEDNIELFRVSPNPTGEKESRWFYRHQLFKIDRESLEKAKSITDKRDLNFGAGGFDLERHLVEMPRRDRRVARMDQSDLEDEPEGAASSGPRRTVRAGAGTNPELYANTAMISDPTEWLR